ncbi:MAG: hypothetical protein LUC34_05555 [Campylobacter sp.]|nr:hypothetical protein [Campylobacter sp.]
MSIKNTQTFSSQTELLNKMDEYFKAYDSVTFYCSNLNKFYPYDILRGSLGDAIMQKLFYLSEDKSIDIVTGRYVDKDSWLKAGLSSSDPLCIKGYGKSIKVSVSDEDKNPIDSFTKSLLNLAKQAKANSADKDKQLKTYQEACDILIDNFKEYKDKILTILDRLKEDITLRVEELLKSEGFDSIKNVKDDINLAFEEINKNIKDNSEDGNGYIIKEIIKAIFSFIDITEPKKAFSKANVLGSVPFLFQTGKNVYSFLNDRWFYAFASPVLNLLMGKFGFIFNLINQSFISDIIVFKSGDCGSFIDFSGFDTNAKLSLDGYINADEYLGVSGDISLGLETLDMRSNKSGALKGGLISLYKNAGKNDNTNSLYNALKQAVTSGRANFIYMQYPYFNSFKLAKLISGKSDETKEDNNSADFSDMPKNYLVISNAPLKTNAALSEYIIKKVFDYKINDEETNKQFTSSKDIVQVKDYSQYAIDLTDKDDEDALMLNLSPFMRIESSLITDFQNDIQKLQDALYEQDGIYDVQKYVDLQTKAHAAQQNLTHMNLFFKTPDDMEEIKRKEDEYIKKSLMEFANFFKRINEKSISEIEDGLGNTITVPLKLDTYTYDSAKVITMPHSAIDVFMMILAFYIIKQTYDESMITHSSEGRIARVIFGEGDENLIINDNEFKVLNGDAYIQTDEGKKRIYFFKDTKNASGNKNAVCIEELEENLHKSFTSEDEFLFNDEIYDSFKKLQDGYGFSGDLPLDERDINEALELDYKSLKLDIDKLRNDKNIDKNEEDYKRYIDFSLTYILQDILKAVFPFSGYFMEQGYTGILKSAAKVIFQENTLREVIMEDIGVLKIFEKINKANLNVKTAGSDKETKRFSKKLKRKAFAGVLKREQKNFIVYYYDENGSKNNIKRLNSILKKDPGALNLIRNDIRASVLKDSLNSAYKAIISSGINFLIDSVYISEYEKQKARYEEIIYQRFTNKYDDPYAVKNISSKPLRFEDDQEDYDVLKQTDQYVYYPLNVYSSFTSIDLKNTFIGGKLSSGGLEHNKFIYYNINNALTTAASSLSKSMPLSRISAYLCLDELRNGKKRDYEFFHNLKDKDFSLTPKELKIADTHRKLDICLTNPVGLEERARLYEKYKHNVIEYKGKDINPIKEYNKAMDILQDLSDGVYDSNEDGGKDSKVRRLLRALDTIGKNNILGIYTGCKIDVNEKTNKDIPPRLIGRLATTIIMKDGLYIG